MNQNQTTPITKHSGKKYLRTIHSAIRPEVCIRVDVYCVLEAFNVDGVLSPPVQHAIKKLLCPGNREKGDEANDILELIEALWRRVEMIRGQKVATVVDLSKDEIDEHLAKLNRPERIQEKEECNG